MTIIAKLAATLIAGVAVLAGTSAALHGTASEKAHELPQSPASPCDEWLEEVRNLKPNAKDALERDGGLVSKGYILLSEKLVPDCNLRGEMSAYLGRVLSVNGSSGDADRRFAAQHSKEIVSVLRALWPSLGDSKALDGDGLSESRYVLLAEPSFDESDIVPLISDILNAETIDNYLGRILFVRPLIGVRPTLLQTERVMEEIDDVPGQILTLTILQKMGDESAFPKLKKLSWGKNLTQFEKKCLGKLISKLESGEKVLFSDIEQLEYQEIFTSNSARMKRPRM